MIIYSDIIVLDLNTYIKHLIKIFVQKVSLKTGPE
jgi:hypothetical protein